MTSRHKYFIATLHIKLRLRNIVDDFNVNMLGSSKSTTLGWKNCISECEIVKR